MLWFRVTVIRIVKLWSVVLQLNFVSLPAVRQLQLDGIRVKVLDNVLDSFETLQKTYTHHVRHWSIKVKGKGRTLVIAPLCRQAPPQRRSGTWRAPSSVAHTCLIHVRMYRVVNIAIQVSLSLVSAIHLEYRHEYCQYFLQQVSLLTVSPILFQPKLRY